MPRFWLISEETANALRALLQDAGNALTDAERDAKPAEEALHELSAGLHSTEAVPDDYGYRAMAPRPQSKTAMKKPDQIVLDLAAMWPITTLRVRRHFYDIDREKTVVVLTSGSGLEAEYEWEEIKDYVEVSVDYISPIRLRDRYQREATAWHKLLKEEAAEYAEYERLKAKFDGDAPPAV